MNVWDKKQLIAPSLISCGDFLNLESSIRQLEKAGAEILHVDILDGHFSPSMPMGFDAVRAVRRISRLPFDCHVMCSSNDYFIDELLDIGAEQIVFHAETEKHIDRQLNRIHAAGRRAGLALKPATPLSVLDYVIEKCDAVLLMLMNPGYADSRSEGQVSYGERKVRELRRLIDSRGLDTRIILDGRISRENIRRLGRTANIFVSGSTCLDKKNLESSLSELIEFCAMQSSEGGTP